MSLLLLPNQYKEMIGWDTKWKVEKFRGDDAKARELFLPDAQPFDVVEFAGNLLMYGGASCLWQTLIGNGSATGSQTLTYFNNGNAYLGVGDNTTAAAATQTDLVAATNKLRKAMDATYPTHTDATTVGAATITFRSTFGTSDANYAWEEVATFNGASGGRMLNRKVQSLGTKTSAATWVLTETITLS